MYICKEKQSNERQMNCDIIIDFWKKIDYHLVTTFFIGLFLISQDYDSQCKKYITHFFLPLHPGNSPFPMRVYKKSTIGIISNHSLQHPSGYYFLCDSMCTGGLSGWNVELASGGWDCVCCGICSIALSSYLSSGFI